MNQSQTAIALPAVRLCRRRDLPRYPSGEHCHPRIRMTRTSSQRIVVASLCLCNLLFLGRYGCLAYPNRQHDGRQSEPSSARGLMQEAEHGFFIPDLLGEHFKITVVEEMNFLTVRDFDKQVDTTTPSSRIHNNLVFGGYLIDMLESIARPDRANFTYELRTPSGYGTPCDPKLDPFESNSTMATQPYDAVYRTQYNCAAADVNDRPILNHTTDIYLGMFYISPARQLVNQFTIPFRPPSHGTLAMYGTAQRIKSFDELVAWQQGAGENARSSPDGPEEDSTVCAPAGTALLTFVKEAFPGLRVRGLKGGQAEVDAAFHEGTCQIYIIDAPIVGSMVLDRSENNNCEFRGQPVGLIGAPMEFGLSHYGIGIQRGIPERVVSIFSYWMNILMSCNSLDSEGPCPDGNFADMYRGQGGTGSECGYVSDPQAAILSPGAIAGIVIAVAFIVILTYTIWHRYRLKRQAGRISILETYRKRLALLDKVADVQRQYLESSDSEIVYSCLLEGILELMDSQFGFIGEVKAISKGHSLLVHAVSARSLDNSAANSFINKTRGSEIFFDDLDNMFGNVILSKKPGLSNEPLHIGKVLPGFPLVQSLLVIPFFKEGDNEISGMIAIADKPRGYTLSDIDFLEPFSATGTNLIQAFWQISNNKHLIDTLEYKVMERTRKLEEANKELADANRKVVEASKAQLRHFACMSHEIRTPLNCIIGLSSLLQESNLDPCQEEEVRMIVSSGDLLLTVVNDVLDYSKLESGNVEILIKRSNLLEAINAVVHSIKTKSKDKGLTIATFFDFALPEYISTDSRRLQQILYNLLGNAVKFSMDGGKVELSAVIATRALKMNENNHQNQESVDASVGLTSLESQDLGEVAIEPEGPQVTKALSFPKPEAHPESLLDSAATVFQPILRFTVKDYGKGISSDDFEKIFEPFSQGKTEVESVFGGTGLGLAITAKLVKALGGSISLDSEEGSWSEFNVELPFLDKPANVMEIAESLKNAHVIFVDKDPTRLEYVSGIFEAYRVSYTSQTCLGELETSCARGEYPRGPVYINLVDEELFIESVYKRLKAILGCSLITFGPKYCVNKEVDGHFRDLTQVFPSVLVTRMQRLVRDTLLSPESDHSTEFIIDNALSETFFTSLRVLIAEDNRINQKVLTRLLNRLGIQNIVVVDDGKKAVDYEAENPVDCVFMDYQMPEMLGDEACRLIKGRDDIPGRPKPKVVFVTAHASVEFENTCNQAGGNGFLPKPFNIRDIEKCFQLLFQ